MLKLTPETKIYVLKNKDKSTYQLVKDLNTLFNVKIDYSSLRRWRIRQMELIDRYVLEHGEKNIDLEVILKKVEEKPRSLLRRYWDGTIASLIYDYYKARKKGVR